MFEGSSGVQFSRRRSTHEGSREKETNFFSPTPSSGTQVYGVGVLSPETGCVFVARSPTSRSVPARNHRSTVSVASGQRAIQESIEGALPPRLVNNSRNFRSEPELQRKSSFGRYPHAIIAVNQLGQLSEDLVVGQSHTHCRQVSEGESSHTRAEKSFTLPIKKGQCLFVLPFVFYGENPIHLKYALPWELAQPSTSSQPRRISPGF